MPRKIHFFLSILLLSCSFCLTPPFADANGDRIDIEAMIATGNVEFPTPDGAGYIQETPEFQRVLENIIGTDDFEKMRNLPPNSQDYQLGKKVGWFTVPKRFDPSRVLLCTGFLVGPDLFMTNHHCIADALGILPLQNAKVYMAYYQEPKDDPTYGGVSARLKAVLKVDSQKDYALLRLDKPIGNTYGWLDLDTTVPTGSVKLISHPEGRSKEIVRKNTEIVPAQGPADKPFTLAYLADAQGGSSGAPVFSLAGTDVIAIHHTGWATAGGPLFNAGSLMAYIVPEIQQFLPGSPPSPTVNQPPAFAPGTSIKTISGTFGSPITPVTFPAATDADGDPLSYSISPTPQAGLVFNATKRLLAGTPTPIPNVSFSETLHTYTASDGKGGTATLAFKIKISAGQPAVNSPPVFAPGAAIANIGATVGTAITPVILPPATDPDGDAIAYSIPGLPAGLVFNATSRLLSGTPTAVRTPTVYYYTADDGKGGFAELSFVIEVKAPPVTPNSPPVFAPGAAIATISATEGTAITPVILPPATDPDGDAITYTLEPALPPGLTFNPAATSRVLFGTPLSPMPITAYIYTATDGKAFSKLSFTIEVLGLSADAPADVNSDGYVNVIDLAIVALFYGTQVPPGLGALAVDVNADGTVDLGDLMIVAESIDAVGNTVVISAEDVSAVLEAVTAQVNVLEAVAGAPGAFSTAPPARVSGGTAQNIAAALEAVKHGTPADARLGKWLPLLRDLRLRLRELRDIPDTAALLPNYPNPFNPETWLPYHLATEAEVRLTIYDLRGTPVRTLDMGQQAPGIYQSQHRAAYWDGKNQHGEKVASGVYFYTLTAGAFTATRKLLILK